MRFIEGFLSFLPLTSAQMALYRTYAGMSNRVLHAEQAVGGSVLVAGELFHYSMVLWVVSEERQGDGEIGRVLLLEHYGRRLL
jgi:hypothetical protein